MSSTILPYTDPLLLQRCSPSEIEIQQKTIHKNTLLVELLNTFPDQVAVLNRHRQIVYANKALINLLGPITSLDIFGKRPGEALDCQQALKSEYGCGASESCTTCGAAKAIKASQQQQKENLQECSITQETTGFALEFRVKAAPLPHNDDELTLFFLTDITNEKRRQALERIFFHDVMNTASGLAGMSRLLSEKDFPAEKKEKIITMIQKNSGRLLEEISAQRELCAAENNELSLAAEPCSTLKILNEIVLFHSGTADESMYNIMVDSSAKNKTIITDRHLLNRILGNMKKNAIEAIKHGETIKLGCRDLDNDFIEFWIHNPGHIQQQHQLQIFRRSFSTKGNGRGLGTYSIKLLGERYLGGKVSFTSSIEKGTTFSLKLPIHLPEQKKK